MKYASNTKVSSDKSKIEIERILNKYGAIGFIYGTVDSKSTIMFEMNGKRIRFDMPLPSPKDSLYSSRGRKRTNTSAIQAHEQSIRQKWRALSLCIKAKLESVESGITTFEEEFFAHILMPNNRTVGQNLIPQLDKMYESGKVPQLLLSSSDAIEPEIINN